MTRWLQAVGVALALAGPVAFAQPAPRAAPAALHKAAVGDGQVNLNQASEEELERLPGVGPTRARAIVAHRQEHSFRRIEELTKVKGIGRKTFGKLRSYLTLTGPTTLKESARRR